MSAGRANGNGFRLRFMKVESFTAASAVLLATAINTWVDTQSDATLIRVDFLTDAGNFVAYVTYTLG